MCSLVVQFGWMVERRMRLMLDDHPQSRYQYDLKLEQNTVKEFFILVVDIPSYQ